MGLFDGIADTGRDAETLSNRRDPTSGGWLDASDAARHIAASAEAAYRFGNLPAQALGLAHEITHPGPGALMDWENNALGADLGARLTRGQIEARMRETGQEFDDARRDLIVELAVGYSRTPAAVHYGRALRSPDQIDLVYEMARQRPRAHVPHTGMLSGALNWLTKPRF